MIASGWSHVLSIFYLDYSSMKVVCLILTPSKWIVAEDELVLRAVVVVVLAESNKK